MPRFLLIAPIYAMSIATGGGQRTFHISRSLAEIGNVDLLLVSESAFADLESTVDSMKKSFPHVDEFFVQRSTEQFIIAPSQHSGRFKKISYLVNRLIRSARPKSHFYRPTPHALGTLSKLIEKNEYRALIGRYLQPTALAGAFAQSSLPVLVDLDDLEDKILASRLGSNVDSGILKAFIRFQLWQVERILRNLRGQSAHLFTASEADRAFIGSPRCSVLPNIPLNLSTSSTGTPRPSWAPLVLFVGSYTHGANRAGIRNFAENSWPDIRKSLPSARLRIVGSGGWESQRSQLESIAGIEVVGAVGELAPHYRAAAFCVVPVDEGSGTKIKVLEALMHSRAVLASEHSAHGYEELIGNGVTTAKGNAQMAAVCIEMLRNPDKCDLLGQTGHESVRLRYSAASVSHAVRAGLLAANVNVS